MRWVRRGRSRFARGFWAASSAVRLRGRLSLPPPSRCGRDRRSLDPRRSPPSGRPPRGLSAFERLSPSPRGRRRSPRPPSRPPRRSRPPRGPSSSRRRFRLPASRVVTKGSSPPDPRISRSAGASRAALSASTEVTSMPSMNCSTSTRRTSPTTAPVGTSDPPTEPLGWRAPAARHVQLPSSRVLVSSISIRGMDRNASRPSP